MAYGKYRNHRHVHPRAIAFSSKAILANIVFESGSEREVSMAVFGVSRPAGALGNLIGAVEQRGKGNLIYATAMRGAARVRTIARPVLGTKNDSPTPPISRVS